MNLHVSMSAFVEVAKAEGFSPAARRLGMSTTAVSRHVAELEQSLGVALLHRTTRKVGLTEAGARYFSRAMAILEEIRHLNAEIAEVDRAPRGTLRLTMPPGTLAMLLPMMVDFCAEYEDIDLEVDSTERIVDLVGEGVDLAIRGAPLSDSTMIVRRLLTIPYRLFASPDYLQRRGVPAVPEDVSAHDCIQWRGGSSERHWTFKRGGTSQAIPIHSRIMLNDLAARRYAAVRGIGLVILPENSVRAELAAGRLVMVLADYELMAETYYFVRPPAAFEPAKVRAFMDFMIAAARNPLPLSNDPLPNDPVSDTPV